MNIWEETSYQLELRQTNAECAAQEYKNFKDRSSPAYKLTFDPDVSLPVKPNRNYDAIAIFLYNFGSYLSDQRMFLCSEHSGSSSS